MTTTRHTMQQLVDALLDKGVHVDPEHPHRVALNEAQAWLAQRRWSDIDPRWAGIGLELQEIEMRDSQNPTLAEQLQAFALQVAEVEAHKDYASAEIHKLRGEVSILWEVAYEGLERGAAFYALVERRTGQNREQAERHFLPDNVGNKPPQVGLD